MTYIKPKPKARPSATKLADTPEYDAALAAFASPDGENGRDLDVLMFLRAGAA